MKGKMGQHSIQLIVQYYRSGDPARQKEIDTCLRNNLENPFLETVHLLTEEQFDLAHFPNHEKIVQTVISERLTYQRAFEYASSIDGEIIWLLANADIYFDDNLRHLFDANLSNVIYALSRHDVLPDGTCRLIDEEYAHGSQDVWIFTAPLRLSEMFTDFNLGVPGCDNRIAYEIIKADYILLNPGKIIKCYHLDLTRETDVAKRTAEYINMHANANVMQMKIAPPPYQFYIFPTDTIGIEQVDVYQKMMKKMLDITTISNNLIDCQSDNKELVRIIGSLNERVSELDQQLNELYLQSSELSQQLAKRDEMLHGLLNSMSWKITSPIRRLLDKFR